ncbi:Ig-like protein group 2 [Thermodesulfitimonas autotrophica]|uniref:Ig-like protein group 2 n=1 Tax=Thermodesulfitimonas autotrophica TaxID=1894989 RepID=A0A3N5AWP5_9THEO|nr:S-layer homology domain-containing protein [Thermodesulfitimonas autotrophica]RPF49337.1 Ig-like protein group 2 [Thermodesulfitimonas autotrophica]
MPIKRKAGRKLCLLLTLLLLVNLLLPCGGVQASAATAPADSAVQFLYNDYQQNGFKNSEYSVGAHAFSVLKQAGVDVSGWVYNGTSLPDAVYNAVYSDLQAPGNLSAKLLAQDLAAAQALGRADWADQLAGVLKDRQSVNSVYGFDLGEWSIFSNMPAFDLLGLAGKIGVVDAAYAESYILGTQNTTAESVVYGAYSWGCTWSGTYYPDFMTTAEAVRALHFLDPAGSDSSVQTAISNGLTWLRQQQMDDGSFVAGMDDPLVDTCEAILTAKALGVDPASWQSSAGKSPVDYLMSSAVNPDGTLGSSKNAMDATWALSALNSLGIKPTVWRFFTDPNSLTLNQNETKDLKAVWQDTYGQHDVTAYAAWSVRDTAIATVDNSVYKGRVTARAAGATTVSAVYGGLTASATVTVKIPVSGGAPAVITPGLAVVGMNGELLFGPAYVAVTPGNKWGLTPLGLLDASGLSYHTSDWAWGILVDAIAGQANSGMAGWMYAVNGQIPAVGPEKYSLKDGDRVIWYYSKSMEQQPPKWEELLARTGGGSYQGPNLPAPVNDSAVDAALAKATATGRTELAAGSGENTLTLTPDQFAKVAAAAKPLAVSIQKVALLLPPQALKAVAGEVAAAARLQIQAQELSPAETQSLAAALPAAEKLVGAVYDLALLATDNQGKTKPLSSSPACYLTLPVPEAASEAAADGCLQAAYYNDAKKSWEKIGGVYDPAGKCIYFRTEHLSKYALVEDTVAKTFVDVKNHWAGKQIAFLANRDLVAGVDKDHFAPERALTRAEFTVLLARLAGLAPAPAGAARFADVPAAAWYRGMVGAAVEAGLVAGLSDSAFGPGKPITREQMAAMLARFLTLKKMAAQPGTEEVPALLARFGDAAGISSWARTAVALSAREGLLTGRANARFAPQGKATRAEAATVLYRLHQRLHQPSE